MAENHFIVTVVDAEIDTVRIPGEFTQRNGNFLVNAVTLRTRDYIECVVYIDKTDGKIWLTMGWKEFAKENGIKNSFLVYFEYVGDTMFFVTIYHTAGCKNPGPDYPIERLLAKFLTCLNTDESLRRLIWAYMAGTLEDFDGQICLYRGWREAAAHLSLERGDICVFRYQGDHNISMVVCRMNKGEITLSYRRLVLDAPQLTLWTTEVTDYILANSKPLYIPAFVVKEYFSDKPEEMNVMLPSGEVQQWSFIWPSKDTNEGYLGHGWYDFVTDITN